MHEIITREQAIERGLKRYFTGKPCKHGHVVDRLVSNKSCAKCIAIIAMNCRKKKPEVIRANRKRYRDKHPEKVLSLRRRRYERENRERRAYDRQIKLAEQAQASE